MLPRKRRYLVLAEAGQLLGSQVLALPHDGRCLRPHTTSAPRAPRLGFWLRIAGAKPYTPRGVGGERAQKRGGRGAASRRSLAECQA